MYILVCTVMSSSPNSYLRKAQTSPLDSLIRPRNQANIAVLFTLNAHSQHKASAHISASVPGCGKSSDLAGLAFGSDPCVCFTAWDLSLLLRVQGEGETITLSLSAARVITAG